MNLFRPERTIARKAERPEPLAPLESRHIQRTPPQRPPNRYRSLAEPQRHPVEANLLKCLILVPRHRLLKLSQSLLLRRRKIPTNTPSSP